MSYKILEQNGIDNENIDGGAFNNFAAGGRDGIVGGVLSECTITATGSVVAIAPGLLMIHGIRVKIEEIETIAIMSVPLRPTSYQLVGQVIVSSKNNVEFSAFIRSPQELAQSNFYTSGEGTYQVELASFVHNPDGSISDLVRTVDIIYGGAGGGTNIEVGNVVTETLPAETDAEFDVTVRNPAGTNKTLLDFTAKIPKGASGTDEGAVHFNEIQGLSEQQKAQARENINAASTNGTYPNMNVGSASAAASANEAMRATYDSEGNNITATYAKQNGSYPNLTAGAAEKAAQDGNGDVIDATYLKMQTLLDKTYPVGAIYMSLQSTSPASLFGGSWTQITNRFLYATGTYGAGATGGESLHTLSIGEMPSHNHANTVMEYGNAKGAVAYIEYDTWSTTLTPNKLYTDNTGSGQAHNNMPPYYVVYMWRRTA